MKFSVGSFGGVAPSVNPRYLPDNRAQIAQNLRVTPGGSLRPLAAPVATLDDVPAGTQTLYRYGQSSGTGVPQWLTWDSDVDVVRGQINGDTEEWTHYTGDGAPKSIYASALQAPVPMGVTPPDTPPIATVIGDPPDNSNEVPETRVYIVTWVRELAGVAAESAPSPAATSVDVYASSQTVDLSLPELPEISQITAIRVYRSTAGTFLYVGEVLAAQNGATFHDTIAADALGEECPSILWSPPPDDLEGLTNLPNGIVAGFVGRDVYFCEPYRPFAWPQTYIQSVDYPIVGLGAIDTTLVVLTTGEPYFIQGGHPDSMVLVRAGIPQACVSKRSIVSLNGAVYYASPDGLMRLSPGSMDLVTRQLYLREQWQALNPESFQAFGHDLQYIALRDNGASRSVWIFDLASNEVSESDVALATAYADLQFDTLFVVNSGTLTISEWAAGSALTAHWKSKKFSLPTPMSFAWVQVMAEAYPVTVKVYSDGVLIQTHTLTSEATSAQRLPPKPGRTWEIEIGSSHEVYAAALAQSTPELIGG